MAEESISLPVETGEPETMASWPTGRLLSIAARLVEHVWLAELERLGLSYAGLIALHFLADGPTSQTDLARRARVENQTMSRTLSRLERQGMIERVQDSQDRRRHVVSRTPTGVAAFKAARVVEKELFPEVEDVAALRRGLMEVIASAESPRWKHE